jgi:hypothetical protein
MQYIIGAIRLMLISKMEMLRYNVTLFSIYSGKDTFLNENPTNDSPAGISLVGFNLGTQKWAIYVITVLALRYPS